MPSGGQPVKIIEFASGRSVEATLHLNLSPVDLLKTEAAWNPFRWKIVERLLQSGASLDQLPQHSHWNWANKKLYLQQTGYRCIGIERDDEMQGLALVSIGQKQSLVAPDHLKPIVYVEFVETAPWNLIAFTSSPRYISVGGQLMQASVQLSIKEGFHGQIGLHSLPQSERYYHKVCGMTDLGVDSSHNGFRYFEMTRNQAQIYLGKQVVL